MPLPLKQTLESWIILEKPTVLSLAEGDAHDSGE